jgi:pimeloyl-ACP methyl ester carboxylesterase
VAAVLFAVRTPDRVDKLMAVSLPLNGTALSRKIAAGGDGLLDRTLGRKQAQQTYPDVAQEADKADPDAITISTQSFTKMDLRLELEKITRPLLIVHGERDSLVTPPPADATQGMDENIRQIALKDSMHFPMMDEAAKFQRLLRDFLENDLASLELKEEWKRRAR